MGWIYLYCYENMSLEALTQPITKVTTPRALVVLTIHSFTRVIQDMTFAPFNPSISDI